MRYLLKLSGETLKGNREAGIDPETTSLVAKQIVDAVKQTDSELVIVIGAGNLFRGLKASKKGMNRVAGDHMGMLATIMNALALQDAINDFDMEARVMSAFHVPQVAEPYVYSMGRIHLANKKIVLCAGGTGNPYFSTDSASVLRALELKCDKVLKATKVDGVYDKDPMKYDDAVMYKEITHQQALEDNLNVMDQTAIAMARENNLEIQVFNFFTEGNLLKVLKGDKVGTIVRSDA